MGWGTSFASAWDSAKDTAKEAAQTAAQNAKSAYEYTADKVSKSYEYTKSKVVEGASCVKHKVVEGAQYAKQKAIEGAKYVKNKAIEAEEFGKNKAEEAREKGYQLAASAKNAVVQGVTRGAIGARYLQALGPAGTAKLAYDKAREALGLNKAGSSVKYCPMCSAKCAKLQDALAKAELAKDSYDVNPAACKKVAGYQRLDPIADKAELSRLLGVKNPDRVMSPRDSDFRASVYKRVKNGKTEYVMAFRGTQTKEDWMENLAQGAGQVGPGQANPTKNQSYSRAMKLLRSFPATRPKRVRMSRSRGIRSVAGWHQQQPL